MNSVQHYSVENLSMKYIEEDMCLEQFFEDRSSLLSYLSSLSNSSQSFFITIFIKFPARPSKSLSILISDRKKPPNSKCLEQVHGHLIYSLRPRGNIRMIINMSTCHLRVYYYIMIYSTSGSVNTFFLSLTFYPGGVEVVGPEPSPDQVLAGDPLLVLGVICVVTNTGVGEQVD